MAGTRYRPLHPALTPPVSRDTAAFNHQSNKPTSGPGTKVMRLHVLAARAVRVLVVAGWSPSITPLRHLADTASHLYLSRPMLSNINAVCVPTSSPPSQFARARQALYKQVTSWPPSVHWTKAIHHGTDTLGSLEHWQQATHAGVRDNALQTKQARPGKRQPRWIGLLLRDGGQCCLKSSQYRAQRVGAPYTIVRSMELGW